MGLADIMLGIEKYQNPSEAKNISCEKFCQEITESCNLRRRVGKVYFSPRYWNVSVLDSTGSSVLYQDHPIIEFFKS